MSNEANGGGMSRVEALDAVAEQLREMVTTLSNTRTNIMCAAKTDPRWEGVADLLKPRIDAARDALKDLEDADALPAAPEPARGEVVEVAVWEWPEDGDLRFARSGGALDVDRHARGFGTKWRRLGTTRLPLVKGDGA